jgi:hypothetical protein
MKQRQSAVSISSSSQIRPTDYFCGPQHLITYRTLRSSLDGLLRVQSLYNANASAVLAVAGVLPQHASLNLTGRVSQLCRSPVQLPQRQPCPRNRSRNSIQAEFVHCPETACSTPRDVPRSSPLICDVSRKFSSPLRHCHTFEESGSGFYRCPCMCATTLCQ